jgi:hypothetical protein
MKEIIRYAKKYKNKNKGKNEQIKKRKKEEATNKKAY